MAVERAQHRLRNETVVYVTNNGMCKTDCTVILFFSPFMSVKKMLQMHSSVMGMGVCER